MKDKKCTHTIAEIHLELRIRLDIIRNIHLISAQLKTIHAKEQRSAIYYKLNTETNCLSL